jgi:hypothetical protein
LNKNKYKSRERKQTMYALATTRFNRETWNEYKRYRKTNNLKGCIYGTPYQMCKKILLDTTVFILEMDNSENRIKGVGMVINNLNLHKYHNIYAYKNYNRYTYKSDYRIDCSEMSVTELNIINVLNVLLFKTKRHLKRGSGITSVPHKYMKIKYFNFIERFKKMFVVRGRGLHPL